MTANLNTKFVLFCGVLLSSNDVIRAARMVRKNLNELPSGVSGKNTHMRFVDYGTEYVLPAKFTLALAGELAGAGAYETLCARFSGGTHTERVLTRLGFDVLRG
jgi:hypothetical protein